MADARGQLNIDIGKGRRTEFKKYCKRRRISMLDMIVRLIDHVLGKEKKEDNERERKTGRRFIQ